MAFDATGRLLIIYSAFAKYSRKKWEYDVHQLFIDFQKAYDSVRRGVLYKILIEFGILRKLVRVTLNPLNWRKLRALNNASKWQMGFNSAFKGLIKTSLTET